MFVWINGRFVDETEAVVSVFDRSFLYGDGLFETLRIAGGKPFRWVQHLERLQGGLDFLKLTGSWSPRALLPVVGELVERNRMPEALLRLSVSRGVGRRGYSPQGAESPTTVLSLHPALDDVPPRLRQWRLRTSSFRLPADEPLAQFKTCNKLPQILARMDADAHGADEALLLNTDGFVVEGASSNLFWIEADQLCTPPLAAGILAGITRAVVVELAESLGLTVSAKNFFPEKLGQTQGVFLSLSSLGIVEGIALDGRALPTSPHTAAIYAAYCSLLDQECRR